MFFQKNCLISYKKRTAWLDFCREPKWSSNLRQLSAKKHKKVSNLIFSTFWSQFEGLSDISLRISHQKFTPIQFSSFSNVFNILTTKRFEKIRTSRERPKSAPYLRLKNSKRTSKCQSIGELGTLF